MICNLDPAWFLLGWGGALHHSVMICNLEPSSVADPGFPVGGHAPIGGGVDLRCRHFLVKMYAKTKELGPIGGGVCLAHPPRSANDPDLFLEVGGGGLHHPVMIYNLDPFSVLFFRGRGEGWYMQQIAKSKVYTIRIVYHSETAVLQMENFKFLQILFRTLFPYDLPKF